MRHSHDLKHNDAITSAGITIDGDMDEFKLNQFMGMLLNTKGEEIFRSKAIIAVADQPK